MLFKLSLRNIKKSLRDYAVYFFTIVIGVSVFYIFNAIGDQSAFMKLGEDTRQIVELIMEIMSGISVFVAVILGMLIVYASRFLMKRRNKEFALYMILGMGKGKISAILLMETVMIGIGSLAVGLIAGIGLSQLMSAVVANLFEADMTDYRFIVSVQAIAKTIIYFSIMYLVVMIFNSFMISRSKLLNLINSGKRSEKLRLKNPVLSAFIFIISSSALGYAYCKLLEMLAKPDLFTVEYFSKLVIIGSVSTLFIFYSVSGLILFIMQKMKKTYYSGLNSFTFRQISSRISTMVVSMTVICLMLFVTICSLCSTISMRNSLNENLIKCCPADAEILFEAMEIKTPITVLMKENGYDLTEDFSEYAEYQTYEDGNFDFDAFAGTDSSNEAVGNFSAVFSSSPETLISVSDYNNVMAIYGKEQITLADDEFLLVCNYKPAKTYRDNILKQRNKITVFGTELTSKTDECIKNSLYLESQEINRGFFVVPDHVIENRPHEDFTVNKYGFVGNFKADSKEAKSEAEKSFVEKYASAKDRFFKSSTFENGVMFRINSKINIAEGAVGLGAIATFVGLYLGLIFLVSCGAILALKQLSESADSIDKYEMLRKLGVGENEISKSLLIQSGIFFILPLLLAVIHSFFGMKFGGFMLESMGVSGMWQSVAETSVFILLIYGGYFLVTYFSSRFIINAKR